MTSTHANQVRTSAQWLEELGRGDATALADLREYLFRGLAKTMRQRMDRSTLDDVTQDSTLKILGALQTYRGEGQFLTWALAVAIRTAFSELRKARWKNKSLESLTEATGDAFHPVSTQPAPGSGDAQAEALEAMRGAIATLSEKQRFVIESELRGVPQDVLVAQLGTNRNALYKLNHDARLKLKQEMGRRGFSEEDVRMLGGKAS